MTKKKKTRNWLQKKFFLFIVRNNIRVSDFIRPLKISKAFFYWAINGDKACSSEIAKRIAKELKIRDDILLAYFNHYTPEFNLLANLCPEIVADEVCKIVNKHRGLIVNRH